MNVSPCYSAYTGHVIAKIRWGNLERWETCITKHFNSEMNELCQHSATEL